MICPGCGINDSRVYIGITNVECPNFKCEYYNEKTFKADETTYLPDHKEFWHWLGETNDSSN